MAEPTSSIAGDRSPLHIEESNLSMSSSFNVEMFKRAAQALALEESLEASDALLSAANAVYPTSDDDLDRSDPSHQGVIILAPPGIEQQQPKSAEGNEAAMMIPERDSSAALEQQEKVEVHAAPSSTSVIVVESDSVVEKKEEVLPQPLLATPDRGEEKPSTRKSSRFSKPEMGHHDDEEDAEHKFDNNGRRHTSPYRQRRSRGSTSGSNSRPSSARSRSSTSKTPRTPRVEDSELIEKLQLLANNASLSFTASQLKILEMSMQQSPTRKGKTSSTSSLITPRLQALAQPAREEQHGRLMTRMEKRLSTYALFDDAKECTFKPKISRRSSESKQSDDHNDGDDDAAAGNDRGNTFMERQEAMEKSKRRELEVARKRKDYEVSLDRKSCPGCNTYQSYDEYAEKRKKCPNCDLMYQRKIDWRSKAKSFHERQAGYIKEKNENLERMVKEEQEHIGRFGRLVIGPDGAKELVLNDRLYWDEVADDFFERMKHYEEKREEMMEALIKERSESLKKSSNFPSPNQRRRSSAAVGGGGEEDS